jgi:hypothetical protein
MEYSLMNDRFGKGKGLDRKKVTSAGIHRINHATGETVSLHPPETSIRRRLTAIVRYERAERGQLGQNAISYRAGGSG